MSNHPGFYYYSPQTHCGECIDDHDRWSVYPDCGKCRETHRIKVELLQLSGRVFTHKAIVRRFDNGKLITVPISSLTYGGNDERQPGV